MYHIAAYPVATFYFVVLSPVWQKNMLYNLNNIYYNISYLIISQNV